MKANELKVGDKFVYDLYPDDGVYTATEIITKGCFVGQVRAKSKLGIEGIFIDEEVTLVSPEKPKLEVGKTYTSNNGIKWECIFIEGDFAWLRGGSDHTAYAWKTGGEPVSLAISTGHTIEFICEGVDVFSSGDVYVGNDKVQLNGTVTTKGGVPDWTTYKEGQ